MYGTASSRKEKLVSELGARPIDYKSVDFVQEIFRLTGNGVGRSFRWSRLKITIALLQDTSAGRLIGYGFGSTVKDRRNRAYQIAPNIINWIKVPALNFITSKTKVIPYSIKKF